MSGILTARQGILAISPVPDDWTLRWEAAGMALGTSARAMPDASGNGRNSQANQVLVVTDAVIGPHRALTGQSQSTLGPAAAYPATTRMTSFYVFKSDGSSNEVMRITGEGNAGATLFKSGRISYHQNAVNPSVGVGNGEIVVAAVQTSLVQGEQNLLRINGTQRSSFTNSFAYTGTLSDWIIWPSYNGPLNSPLVGFFSRFLSVEEIAAVEGDLRSRFGF